MEANLTARERIKYFDSVMSEKDQANKIRHWLDKQIKLTNELWDNRDSYFVNDNDEKVTLIESCAYPLTYGIQLYFRDSKTTAEIERVARLIGVKVNYVSLDEYTKGTFYYKGVKFFALFTL